MKPWQRHLLLIAFLLNGLYLSAQVLDEDTTRNEPFFKARKFNSKCYVEFNGQVSQVLKSQAAMSTGASLNWLVNHKLVLSAEYRILTTPLNVQGIVAPDEPNTTINLANQYAGLGFGYIFFNSKTFSLQPQLSAGWADVNYEIGHAYYTRSFGEITPTVYGTYNATKYFRFGVALNYRAAVGCNANGLNDAYLSGIGGMLFLRVGTF